MRCQKRTDQITVTGMNLDKIEAGRLTAARRSGKITHYLSDLIDGERLDDRGRARVEHGGGHGRHTGRRQLHPIAGLHAAVEELNTELGVVLMDRVDQFLEGRNASVVI